MRGAKFEMSVNIVTFSLGLRLTVTDGRTPQQQSLPCIVAQHLFLFARMAAWFQSRFQRDLCQSDINATILINRSLGWAQEKKNDWALLHIMSVSSMFLGRTFLV